MATADGEASRDDESTKVVEPLPGDPDGSGKEPITQQRVEAIARRRVLSPEPVGNRIGRYLVLEAIGRGGMGEVYAAYDEQLDRKVAIKVMLDDQLGGDAERRRFKREAQALARLSHPNVVTVHEVGESDGQVFLAMEYVHGQSVSAWLRTKPAWPKVLEVFVQAGRGLVAAHQAELVHRDLKPANIIRSDEGVVKVLDFGLARSTTEELDESVDERLVTSSQSALSSSLTQTGMVMGTPAYMAPEQLSGGAVDARSDQYSFCVALWEGLVGSRPFQGSGVEDLLEAKHHGPPPWPSAAPPVPRAIVEALRRGLSVDPSQRWASMEDLLQQLSLGKPRRARNRWLAGLVAVGVLGLGGASAQAWYHARAQRCTGAGQQLAGTWDDARRAAVEAAIIAIGGSYATAVWDRTRQKLDAYAAEWEAMHTEACEATAVRAEQSPRVLDLRMRCLQRAAQELGATVDTLAEADATVVSKAHELVAGLPPLSRCEDTEALEADVEPPLPGEAEAVEATRRQLARAKSEEAAGRYQPARAAVEAATQALEGVDYWPARAELALARGRVLASLGEYDEAVEALLEAVHHASRSGQRGLVADTATALMDVVGTRQKRAEAAMLLRPFVLGSSHEDPAREGRSRSIIAGVLRGQGKYDEAQAELRAALALQTETVGLDHPDVARTRTALAGVLVDTADYEAAEAELRAVLALRVETLGPSHPAVAQSRNNLGIVLTKRGEYEDAEAELRKALALRVEALGPDHPDVAQSHNGLASVLYKKSEYEEAEAEAREALALRLKVLGHDHLDVAESRNNLATMLTTRGDYAAAEAEYRAALASRVEALGPDHPDVASSRSNLGMVLGHQGNYAAAEVEYRAGLASRVEALGSDHPDVANSRSNLAHVLRVQGKHEEAESEMRKALAIEIEALGPDHPEVGGSRNDLAVVLAAQGKYEEAEVEIRASLASATKSLGPDHPDLAALRLNLASSLVNQRKYEEAEVDARAALAVFLANADRYPVEYPQAVLAEALLELHREEEALPLAEAAWAKRQSDTLHAISRASGAFLLARILWDVARPARDRTRSKVLAEDALRYYRAAGDAYRDDALEVEQWLEHRAP